MAEDRETKDDVLRGQRTGPIAGFDDEVFPSRRLFAAGEIVSERYRITKHLATGGMGEVVALKTLAITAVDQTDAVKRLLAEVRIARKVTHPNVCRILEFGTHQRAASTDRPVPFLTMPLLHGETLARRLQSIGRMPPR